jgi:competence protein ComEC
VAYGEDNRTRAKAWAAGIDAARRRTGVGLPDGLAAPAARLRHLLSQWVLAEVAPGRLLPWLPVAYGFDIVIYFTADREPAWWAATIAAAAGIVAAILARRRAVGFSIALALAAIASGFATAILQTARIAHPVLGFSTWSAQVEGFVEVREEREPSDRIVVRVTKIDVPRMHEVPERVRVAVRRPQDVTPKTEDLEPDD